MASKQITTAFCIFIAVAALSSTGCVTSFGPNLGFLAFPIPVSPYHQKIQEDKHWNHERYERVPILDPIPAGVPARAVDAPSDDQVMRALEKVDQVQGGLPLLYEVQRNNVIIHKEKLQDFVDKPRVIPLAGPVQLHHSRWKCTVYYTRVVRVGWPLPHTLVDEDAREVLYIDNDHFHRVGGGHGGGGGASHGGG